MTARKLWPTWLKHGQTALFSAFGPGATGDIRTGPGNSTDNICYHLHKTSAKSETSRHCRDFRAGIFCQCVRSQASNARGVFQIKCVGIGVKNQSWDGPSNLSRQAAYWLTITQAALALSGPRELTIHGRKPRSIIQAAKLWH